MSRKLLRSAGWRGRAFSPLSTASASAQSATLSAIGPTTSRVDEREKAPSVGTRPEVGLKPTAPDRAAGIRSEPPVSLPMAMSAIPSMTETTAPDDEPPVTLDRSRGLPGSPSWGLSPTAENANSVI
jgi:hypothetical protein